MQKNVLVTGGLGFIGSNFLNQVVPVYTDHNFLNVDGEKYAANHNYISAVNKLSNYSFLKANLAEFDEYPIVWEDFDMVINFAALSHVANSIEKSGNFIDVNIKGVYYILEALRAVEAKKKKNIRFHHVSTDEVYGDAIDRMNGGDNENTKYRPTNPYAATKGASDLLIHAYHKTYGLNTTISNCCNNYGPYQHEEKLVPRLIHNFIKKLPIMIHGDGQQVRDWIYVDDHCDAVWTIANEALPGKQFNVSGRNHMTNLDMIKYIYGALKEKGVDLAELNSYLHFAPDRGYNDRKYHVDDSLLRDILGWRNKTSFKVGMDKTVNYYINKWA